MQRVAIEYATVSRWQTCTLWQFEVVGNVTAGCAEIARNVNWLAISGTNVAKTLAVRITDLGVG